MPFNVDDCVRVTIRGRIHNQKTINILHFKTVAAGGDEILAALLTAVIICIVQELMPKMSSEMQFEGATATKLTGTFDEITDASQSVNGTVITDALPSLCAGVIRFHTAQQGRRGRGRMFIAGAPEQDHADSSWEAPDTTFGEFLNCLLDKFKLNGGTDTHWKLCVFSRKTWQENNNNFPLAMFPVVGGSVNGFVCTMRSRKPGHGD